MNHEFCTKITKTHIRPEQDWDSRHECLDLKPDNVSNFNHTDTYQPFSCARQRKKHSDMTKADKEFPPIFPDPIFHPHICSADWRQRDHQWVCFLWAGGIGAGSMHPQPTLRQTGFFPLHRCTHSQPPAQTLQGRPCPPAAIPAAPPGSETQPLWQSHISLFCSTILQQERGKHLCTQRWREVDLEDTAIRIADASRTKTDNKWMILIRDGVTAS